MSWKESAVYVKCDSGHEANLHSVTQRAKRVEASMTGIFPLRDLALIRELLYRTTDAPRLGQCARDAYTEAATIEECVLIARDA